MLPHLSSPSVLDRSTSGARSAALFPITHSPPNKRLHPAQRFGQGLRTAHHVYVAEKNLPRIGWPGTSKGLHDRPECKNMKRRELFSDRYHISLPDRQFVPSNCIRCRHPVPSYHTSRSRLGTTRSTFKAVEHPPWRYGMLAACGCTPIPHFSELGVLLLPRPLLLRRCCIPTSQRSTARRCRKPQS